MSFPAKQYKNQTVVEMITQNENNMVSYADVTKQNTNYKCTETVTNYF